MADGIPAIAGRVSQPIPRANGFEHIRKAVARLKAEVEQAIALRDEDVAAAAHRDLTDLEHELRTRETVARCAATRETTE